MATLQPGQVTVAGQVGATGGTATVAGATGLLTHPDNKFPTRTNAKTAGAAGVETPFGVLGGTIADQITRAVIDTRNQTNVGAASGPDTEAPRVWEP